MERPDVSRPRSLEGKLFTDEQKAVIKGHLLWRWRTRKGQGKVLKPGVCSVLPAGRYPGGGRREAEEQKTGSDRVVFSSLRTVLFFLFLPAGRKGWELLFGAVQRAAQLAPCKARAGHPRAPSPWLPQQQSHHQPCSGARPALSTPLCLCQVGLCDPTQPDVPSHCDCQLEALISCNTGAERGDAGGNSTCAQTQSLQLLLSQRVGLLTSCSDSKQEENIL